MELFNKKLTNDKKEVEGDVLNVRTINFPHNSNYMWYDAAGSTWQPEEGDIIIGQLINKKVGLGKYSQNLYTLRTDDGELILIWGKTQLNILMDNTMIGDYLKITYCGQKKTKDTDRFMKYYNVMIRKTIKGEKNE